ncbi:MAG: hypothetical protein IKO07_03365 [Clostridia bacterium]|nr:hypothetical protein [Clostridia bacterium]
MKKTVSLLLIAVLACLALAGCSGTSASTGEPTSLSFSGAASIETIQALNGKTVTIVGYMATLSPISGKYMYLMNMPYQSCPFCVPNTAQLSNTMAVYAPSGKTFQFTDQAVRITGRMETGDFTDEFGYTYNYRIADAACEEVDLATVSENYKLWQAIASDGIVAEVNAMFDYLHFICCWPTYSASYVDDDGNEVSFFLYAGDVAQYLADDSVYGYADKAADDYFPGLVARARAISETELNDLIAIINDAKSVETYAMSELDNGNYTYDEAADQFSLNNQDDLYNRWLEVYTRFSEWLAKWEL